MESNERKKLQVLTSLGWTQAVYWAYSPNTSTLSWSDGVYNGGTTTNSIKPGCDEKRIERELLLQNSQCSNFFNPNILKAQLLCTASLDLSDSEWFYIVSTAFSFPLGVDILGTAMQSGKWQWICGIQNIKSSNCVRVKLANSGGIKTLLVIPLQNGVVELASNQELSENASMVQYAEALFHDQPSMVNYGAFFNQNSFGDTSGLLESLTSSSLSYPQATGANSVIQGDTVSINPQGLLGYPTDEPQTQSQVLAKLLSEQESQLATKASIDSNLQSMVAHLELPLNKREISSMGKVGINGNGSPSNAHESQFQRDFQNSRRFKRPYSNLQGLNSLHPNKYVANPLSRMGSGEEIQSVHLKTEFPSPDNLELEAGLNELDVGKDHLAEGENGWTSGVGSARGKSVPQLAGAKLNGNPKSGNSPFDPTGHIMTERRRREKLNSQFLALRAVVPKVSKMDKASVLSDAVSYINDLKQRISELESRAEKSGGRSSSCKSSIVDAARSGTQNDKSFDNFGDKADSQAEIEVQVVENTAIITVRCPKRPRLQSDILVILNDLELDLQHANISTFGNISLCIFNTIISSASKLNSNEIVSNLRCMLDGSNSEKSMEKCSSPVSNA